MTKLGIVCLVKLGVAGEYPVMYLLGGSFWSLHGLHKGLEQEIGQLRENGGDQRTKKGRDTRVSNGMTRHCK